MGSELTAGDTETRPARRALLPWLTGAGLLLVFPLAGWMTLPDHERFLVPTTPMDGTHLLYAGQWRFLWQVRARLPEAGTYTVRAADRDQEWTLFMLSLSVLPEYEAHPASYYGHPGSPLADQASFVLDFGCHLQGAGDLRPVARFAEGCLLERSP